MWPVPDASATTDPDPSAAPDPAPDPVATMRSPAYRRLLVVAALVGVLVSLASWAFLELVHLLQQEIFDKLPGQLGFAAEPWWWPLPLLAVAGLLTAVAVLRLPGAGGHVPYLGLGGGGAAKPIDLPGVLLAAFASLGLGVVLGPEAPLIALGAGLGAFAVTQLRKDTPQPAVALVAAAGSFAAIATVFGSPVIGAVIMIEAAGVGGGMLPVLLLPGLMAAGIGSLVFIGMQHWTGLSNTAYALTPFELPSFDVPTFGNLLWAIVLSVVAAVAVYLVIALARGSAAVVRKSPWVLLPATGLVIGGLAIAFSEIAHEPSSLVLFSGQDSFTQVFQFGPTAPLSALLLLVLFKSAAWALSLGSFRGGPTFPALFIGAVGGLLAGHLPGLSETPAVAVLMGATAVAMLRLPLSAVVMTMLLTAKTGGGVVPLIIVGVVVSYIVTLILPARAEARAQGRQARSAALAEGAT
jgi:H+/Cl- antiporter ClcA